MSNPYDPTNSSGDQDANPANQGTPGSQPPPPPYGDAGQGGQPPPPYGQTPYPQDASGPGSYGQQPPYGQAPYSQAPYDKSPYGQGGYVSDAPKKTDVVSIIGFILSLTGCLSLIGAIMGAIGLKRTKNGQRKGRWAAIAALVIGILGTLALGGIVAAIGLFANSVIAVDGATVGQCANISSEDAKSVLLTDADCTGDHDAEIVYTGTYGEVENSQFVPSNPDDLTDAGISYGICTELMTNAGQSADLDALGDDVTYQFVTMTADPPSSEAFYCYAERTDQKPFTSKRLP